MLTRIASQVSAFDLDFIIMVGTATSLGNRKVKRFVAIMATGGRGRGGIMHHIGAFGLHTFLPATFVRLESIQSSKYNIFF
jgi:hypothetical protein